MLRDRFGTQVSEADGLPLPLKWDRLHTHDKGRIIRHLNGHDRFGVWPESTWREMPYTDRKRVTDHLKVVGSIEPTSTSDRDAILLKRAQAGLRAHRASREDGSADWLKRPPSNLHRIEAEKLRDEYRSAYPARPDMADWSDPVKVVCAPPATAKSYGLYDKPNGRKRMLPSLYGKLREFWVQGDGRLKKIDRMNDGHLKNTLELLKESHGNVVARATDLLGRMALHFQNQPGLAADLQQLCLEMQQVEVDDMYPVFAKLAEEFETRVHAVDEDVQLDLDLTDDALESWARNEYH